jgi:phenylpropionate dioxygenase-like ring-hydroxylating dioxygenase large terminal subunit
MHRTVALLLGAVVAAACSNNPTATRDDAADFPLVAHWTATATPIAPATITGQLQYDQHLGFHSDVSFAVTGPPNGVFQWRIFKRDCTVNVAAVNNTAPTGLVLFATTQSYPDFTLDASGKATVKVAIAGWLDSLTAYSVRIRPTATTSFTGVNPASCGNLKYTPAN